MPPLSAYTPFESLLFFQSLAAHDHRPTNFLSISDILRNNPFIRQNVAFDATRLAPEALEDLYTTLMREGADPSNIAPLEPNGGHLEPSNPKKRKITSARPDGLGEKAMNHVSFVPGLVSHLYARYKELVMREIRNEEKRYHDIRNEIDRLQKEVPEPCQKPAPQSSTAQKPSTQPPPKKHEPAPAPEPMDIDLKEEKPGQQLPLSSSQNPVKTTTNPEAKQDQVESQPKTAQVLKQQLAPAPPHATPPEQQPPIQPSTGKSSKDQPKKATPMPLPPQHQPPPFQASPPQPIQPANAHPPIQPSGGKPSTTQKPNLAPRNISTNLGAMPTPPTQPPIPVSSAQPPNSGAGKPLAPTPSQGQQKTNIPISPSPQQQQPVSAIKPPPTQEKPMGAPPPVQRLPPQPTFQQWSLNQHPQTPRPSSHPIPAPDNQANATKPQPPLTPQQIPKPEPKKPLQPLQPTPVPSTPGPASTTVQSPAPSGFIPGFQTPVAAAQSLLSGGPRRPRLSLDTPGSSTPWKRTPQLSISTSPRSPDRPRPEDVSPISEKAPSLMGSREATPEEPEPPRKRRRNEGKGDVDSKSGLKAKSEKPTLSSNKRRDQSTASSRSRGRSVLSRDDESEAVPSSKIKYELPTTPAGVPETVEAEQRAGRKGAFASEDRPGRGRPKRKRAPSETLEAEPLPSETPQLSRLDPDQSAPYVLCARNFPRTGAPIMNDVTTHKHASIFTKPLTNRDAPGYRDLIYRPQDLKSIKSSIHQGSRAVAAATEAANTPVADGESPAPNSGTPSKNAVLMLQKTEDVIPPKGIVNSAQLEKELIRMFANAVMFNPVPQRGFGPAFLMTSDAESRASTQVPEPDEGGIIKDTIEMFDDVEQAVTRWRAAERTADELATKSILSLRRGSASDPNTDSADEVKG
ncbi:hypothetical protein FE257_009884 [Aspergillus nanangensis]|uniref:Bromo domain-containing protein n=1 Tax=Aspergillus nanangensis TaxID=2582783 RepID=A0AAD4CVX9_ASPNN|nr:hypothetical protein FE257_009884 [Aspergillus nanangensis]